MFCNKIRLTLAHWQRVISICYRHFLELSFIFILFEFDAKHVHKSNLRTRLGFEMIWVLYFFFLSTYDAIFFSICYSIVYIKLVFIFGRDLKWRLYQSW